jgi:hypothetical protein
MKIVIILLLINGLTLIFEGAKIENPSPHPFPEIFKKQLEVSNDINGGFFEYEFKKPNSSEKFEKISFVKQFDEYGWIIGSGVYLDEINNELIKKEDIFKKKHKKSINFNPHNIYSYFASYLLSIYKNVGFYK